MMNDAINHYRITAKLGKGGMGEVYRATDTMLEREVAIKILPQSFAADNARLARFKREAKVLAALNHSNIAVIYGIEESVETHALIMELVEGETLAERLQREPMTIEEALDCCRQIAEALEAAHEKGIIHRDLKPENVKIDQDGRVKVLDFGLAKEVVDPTSSGNQAESPTITHMTTVPGELLGTAPYMSPEQARARPVDKRSDIWSFGCVLYECLTGKPIFGGEDVTETLASIIKGEPDWDALPEDTPPTIELLLRKCLAKDRKRRLHDIADARIDVEQALGDPVSSIIRLSEGALRENQARRGLPYFAMASILLFAIIVTSMLAWLLKPTPKPSTPKHSEILFGGSAPLNMVFASNAFALSRDGKSLVYNLNDQGGGFLRRNLVTGEDKRIPGAANPLEGCPFLSWDGSRLGCLFGNKLVTIPTIGGTPHALAVSGVSYGAWLGADWSKDGEIVFASAGQPLKLISENGGQAKVLTQLAGDYAHAFPQFLPDRDHVLFIVEYFKGGPLVGRVCVVNVTTGERKDLDVGECRFARYCASGHLLYSMGNDLFAKVFDLKRMAVRGPAKMVLQGVGSSEDGWRAQFDVANDGTLVYLPGKATETRTLMLVDTDGRKESFTNKRGKWQRFDLSPNEERVALEIDGDIWILDKVGQVFDQLRPLVTNNAADAVPLWSLDNEWVYFSSNRDGKNAIWKKKADFSDVPAELVCESKSGPIVPQSVSSHYLMMCVLTPDGGYDIWKLDLNGEKIKPEPLMNKEFAEAWPVISPDGKWLAYFMDDEAGPECYLRPMDGSGASELVSNGGGYRPRWPATGDQVFYLLGSTVFSVSLPEQRGRLTPGKPKEILTLPQSPVNFQWAVAQDGQRFLVLVEASENESEGQGSPEPAHLEMISNWFTELNEKVPPAGAN